MIILKISAYYLLWLGKNSSSMLARSDQFIISKENIRKIDYFKVINKSIMSAQKHTKKIVGRTLLAFLNAH